MSKGFYTGTTDFRWVQRPFSEGHPAGITPYAGSPFYLVLQQRFECEYVIPGGGYDTEWRDVPIGVEAPKKERPVSGGQYLGPSLQSQIKA